MGRPVAEFHCTVSESVVDEDGGPVLLQKERGMLFLVLVPSFIWVFSFQIIPYGSVRLQ